MKITLGPRSNIPQHEFEATHCMPFIAKALMDSPLVSNLIDGLGPQEDQNSPQFKKLVEISEKILTDLTEKDRKSVV